MRRIARLGKQQAVVAPTTNAGSMGGIGELTSRAKMLR